ncbi:hypothetical protein KY385_04070 [Candidatus Parcubacteria bacterium]|nr:hypothetical protein [Candidatus Parcubacteria bacterium]
MTEKTLPCGDKMAFDSQKQAQAVATTLAGERGIKLKAYPCSHCQLWHLSSS